MEQMTSYLRLLVQHIWQNIFQLEYIFDHQIKNLANKEIIELAQLHYYNTLVVWFLCLMAYQPSWAI